MTQTLTFMVYITYASRVLNKYLNPMPSINHAPKEGSIEWNTRTDAYCDSSASSG